MPFSSQNRISTVVASLSRGSFPSALINHAVSGRIEIAGARLLIPEAPITERRHHSGRRRTRAAGILFRNAISRATVTEHAIARATEEEQYAMLCAGRFRTTSWSVVLLSVRVAADGRLGP